MSKSWGDRFIEVGAVASLMALISMLGIRGYYPLQSHQPNTNHLLCADTTGSVVIDVQVLRYRMENGVVYADLPSGGTSMYVVPQGWVCVTEKSEKEKAK